jgi:uncharacterized protein (DUF1684 family)
MAGPEEAYRSSVERWHSDRVTRLREPEGWLSLVALHWLSPGLNEVALTGGSVPAFRVVVADGEVRAVGDALRHEGGPLPPDGLPLAADADGDPTRLELGSLRIILIRRGERLALRAWDRETEALRRFAGIHRFGVDPRWRIDARYEPVAGRSIAVPDVTGGVAQEPSPGSVAFSVEGVECRLDALEEGERGELWLVFGDRTNGAETYSGGRFLYTAPPLDGRVVVDFNRAYNPPCVFTPYATCPLPPAQNRLPVRIEAGEKEYHPS